MRGSRLPGPIGTNDADQERRPAGLLGGGGISAPLGSPDAEPLETRADENKPAAAGKEVNLVGSYPKPDTWTAAKEKELIGKDTWFPHTLDFLEVAGKGSKEITSPEHFLLAIIETSGQINRLNYFSHGVTGKIATSGKVDPAGTSCSLDTGWEPLSGPRYIAHPYSKIWGGGGEDSGSVSISVGSRSFTLDDVRKKFTDDAELWLFICHGGVDTMLLQNIANTFRVRVKAFSKIIVYCAPANFPTSRKHKVNVLTGAKPIDACPNAVDDFRKLKSDRGAAPKI